MLNRIDMSEWLKQLEWMDTWQDVLLILAGLYLLLCIVYALDCFYTEGSMQETLYGLVVCIFLPGVGFVLVWMKRYYAKRQQVHDLSSVMKDDGFFEDDLSVLKAIDQEAEMNHVPMEEALSMNNYDFRRKRVMETLNFSDAMSYMGVLRMAMENEDSETSHYASSIIMLLQEQMQTSLQKKSYAWEQNKADRAAGCQYETELYRLLSGELMDAQSLHRYHIAYAQLSDELLGVEKPEEMLLQHRGEIAMAAGDLSAAAQVIERYLSLYPHSEEAVYQKIMLCIRTRDRSALQEFCNSLSERPVALTRRVLDYIRFFISEQIAGGEA